MFPNPKNVHTGNGRLIALEQDTTASEDIEVIWKHESRNGKHAFVCEVYLFSDKSVVSFRARLSHFYPLHITVLKLTKENLQAQISMARTVSAYFLDSFDEISARSEVHWFHRFYWLGFLHDAINACLAQLS